MSHLSKFATVDPSSGMNGRDPGQCQNLVSGQWRDEKENFDIIKNDIEKVKQHIKDRIV